MSDLYNDSTVFEEVFIEDDIIFKETSEGIFLDARRRLEKLMEDKSLEDELRDF